MLHILEVLRFDAHAVVLDEVGGRLHVAQVQWLVIGRGNRLIQPHVQGALAAASLVLSVPVWYYFHPLLGLRAAGLNVMLRPFVGGRAPMLLTHVVLRGRLDDLEGLQHVGAERFVKSLVHDTRLLGDVDVYALRRHQGVLTSDRGLVLLLVE